MKAFGRWVIYRYRASKPETGHVSFKFHDGAEIVYWTEHWHGDKGWELIIDVWENTAQPRVDRRFFLCNAGDDLTVLGEFGLSYMVGVPHASKAYASYLFETTHLSETERQDLHVRKDRYSRKRPGPDERSVTERQRDAAAARARATALRVVQPPAEAPAAVSEPQAAAEEA